MSGAARTTPSRLGRPATSRTKKPPRPPNAWILYRSDKIHQLPPLEPGQPRRSQAEVSRIISAMWANELDEVHQEYERRAEAAKAEHALKYPGYRFKPMTKEEKRAQKQLEQDQRLAKRRGLHNSESRSDLMPQSPPPAPLPQYYASVNTPINLSQFGHGSITPFSYSVTTPQARYEPAGPTPPVSAAGSPTNPSPPPAQLTSTDEVQSLSNTMDLNLPSVNQSMTVTPATPSSTISTPALNTPLFPTFNSSAFASGQEWTSAPTSATEDNEMSIPDLTPSSAWGDLDPNQQLRFQPSQGQYTTTQAAPHVRY